MCAWTPTSSTPGHELECGDGLRGGTRGHREAELGVLLPGAHELVRVRLDTGGDPDEDLRAVRAGWAGLEKAPEPGDLVEGVDDDPADAMLQRRGQLVGRLVVAVQDEPIRRDTGGERDVELTAGSHIEVHALLVGQPGHGAAQERLGGVGDAVAPGRDGLAAGLAQVVLVVDEQRRPELARRARAGRSRRRADGPCRRPTPVRGSRWRSRGAVATSWSVGMEVQDTAAFDRSRERAGRRLAS